MIESRQTQLDQIAARTLRALAGNKYAYAALIPGAIRGEGCRNGAIPITADEEKALVDRVSAALRVTYPVSPETRARRIARDYDRLVSAGREDEAQTLFDECAP